MVMGSAQTLQTADQSSRQKKEIFKYKKTKTPRELTD
jgi:gas vesicle protein